MAEEAQGIRLGERDRQQIHQRLKMATISISLPDELVHYLDEKVQDKNLLITSILQQWQRQQEDQELAQACSIIDKLDLGWTEECQTEAIMDLEVSGL